MHKKRIRKRLTRKNNSLVQTLDISFTPTNEGVDVDATYGDKKVISTKFTKQLSLEDQQEISESFFLGYSYAQFKVDCPELSDSCTGWRRSKKKKVE